MYALQTTMKFVHHNSKIANTHKNKIYALQTIMKFTNYKSKITNNHKNKIYVLQKIMKFANHRGKTTNKNNKGKKSSVIPIFSMADRRGKWSYDLCAAYCLIGYR